MDINTAPVNAFRKNLNRFFINLFRESLFSSQDAARDRLRASLSHFISLFRFIKVQISDMAGTIHSIIGNFAPKDKSSLIAILQAVQKQEGFISPESIETISRHLGVSKSQVFGVATFYRSFSFKPKGECCISVCMGTACHVRGAQMIAEEYERLLGIKAGETTQDLKFTLETVNCLGACALGPIVVENEKYHGQMNIGKAKILLEKLQGKNTPQNS